MTLNDETNTLSEVSNFDGEIYVSETMYCDCVTCNVLLQGHVYLWCTKIAVMMFPESLSKVAQITC